MAKPSNRSISTRHHRWTVTVLRWSAVAFMLSTLAQAVLAGMFVTGDVDLLAWHETNANASPILLVIVAAILVWRPGRGPAWPIWMSIGLAVLVEAQKMLGYLRMVDLHIPVGVAIFGLSVWLVVWSFTIRLPDRPPDRRTDEPVEVLP